MNVERLIKMAGAVRTGGKRSMRRKKKAIHKTTTADDKRLQSTLKRIRVNAIQLRKSTYSNPKELQDSLPGIINQLGTDNLDNLRKLAEQYQKQAPPATGATATITQEEGDDDDEVPQLVPGETFEAAAEGQAAK